MKLLLKNITPHKLGEWYEKHERILEPFVFVGGFLFDNLTLQRIDQFIDILILGTWLLLACGGIILLNLVRYKVVRGEFFETLESWVPVVIQFSFGALFSGFTIFYMRSANLATSWPFLIIVLFLFFGNEFFKKRYLELSFQLSVFFVSVLFLSIFFIPILLGRMGQWVFLLSGVISVVIIGLLVHFLFAVLPHEAKKGARGLFVSISGIFVVVNILYFLNIIPPIPLSLKEAGIYHFVTKLDLGGEYWLRGEPLPWYHFFEITETVHLVPGDSLYFYSAVFSPTDLNTTINHVWERYDAESRSWVFAGRIRFPIYGGSDRGYRGYSEKTAVVPGLWRVLVTNDQGQVLGTTKFQVVSVGAEPVLETKTRQ